VTPEIQSSWLLAVLAEGESEGEQEGEVSDSQSRLEYTAIRFHVIAIYSYRQLESQILNIVSSSICTHP